jgi:acid phosphatase
MKKTLFALLLAVVTSVLGSTDSDNGRFLLIGDWGRRPENSKLHANQRQVAEAMGKATANNKPAAVICLGDNFYPSGAPTVDSPMFEQAFEKVYTAPSLQVPFWIILGNHDYYESVQGELDYAKQRRGTGRWTLPSRYWSRTIDIAPGTKAKFIFLDTSPFVRKYANGKESKGLIEATKQDTAAQLAWLEKELSEPGIAWRIVCGHHPIWSGGDHGDTEEIKEFVLPILQKHKVQLYACGHDHHAEVFVREQITAVVSGNASETRTVKETQGSIFRSKKLGFADLVLGSDKGEIRMIDADGNVMFTQSLTR